MMLVPGNLYMKNCLDRYGVFVKGSVDLGDCVVHAVLNAAQVNRNMVKAFL